MELSTLQAMLDDQHGVVSRSQLLDAGCPAAYARRMLRRGLWSASHRGVYVTHNGPQTWMQRAWCGILSAAPAVLSHESAIRAALGQTSDDGRPIHVAVADTRSLPKRAQVQVHYRGALDDRALWTTHPPRMRPEHAFLEMAAAESADHAAVAKLSEAVQSRLTTADKLITALEARPTLERRAFLLAVLIDVRDGACSVLEHDYLNRVERAHGLPTGIRQAPTKAGRPGFRDVDYDDWRLIVELDGRLGHDDAASRDRDLERDLDAAVEADKRTARVGYRQVTSRACSTASKVGALLNKGGWSGSPTNCGPECSLPQGVSRSSAD